MYSTISTSYHNMTNTDLMNTSAYRTEARMTSTQSCSHTGPSGVHDYTCPCGIRTLKWATGPDPYLPMAGPDPEHPEVGAIPPDPKKWPGLDVS